MENLKLSFVHGEFLPKGTILVLETSRPVTAQTAGSAILIKAGKKTIKAAVSLKDQSTIQVSTDSLDPGTYRLTVIQLTDNEGKILTSYGSASFAISSLKGAVPQELRVEHIVHLAVGDLSSQRLEPGTAAPSGTTYVEIIKASNRQTGELQTLAFHDDGSSVDPDKDLQAMNQRRTAKFGPLSEILYNKISTLKDTDKVNILVWPIIDFDLHAYTKSLQDASTGPPPDEKALLSKISKDHLRSIESAGIAVEVHEPVNLASGNASVAQIRKLATDPAVGLVDFDDKVTRVDLTTSTAISRTDDAKVALPKSLGDGSGINVAIYENGPLTEDLTNLSYTKRYLTDPPSPAPDMRFHPRLTSAIVKNVQTAAAGVSNGYAPKCNLYSANSTDRKAIKWAKEESCTVISQSFHSDTDCKDGNTNSEDKYKDVITKTYPYPLFCQAAGNYWDGDPDNIKPPWAEYVNHKTYNSLSVGNHNDTADDLDATSVYKNPITPRHDRELPEICANGVSVTAIGIPSQTGTSFAAPAVAGVAVLLQQFNVILKHWPEATRAILLASAGRGINGLTWYENITQEYHNDWSGEGAGCMNAEAARQIAQNLVMGPNSGNPTQTGWTAGSLVCKTDFDSAHRAINPFFMRHSWKPPVKAGEIPNPVRMFKVVLAWDSKVTIDPKDDSKDGSVLAIDLDLEVKDFTTGEVVGFSRSWDNSYEVVDFNGLVDHTYKISAMLSNYGAAKDESTWFGLAWRAKLIEEE